MPSCNWIPHLPPPWKRLGVSKFPRNEDAFFWRFIQEARNSSCLALLNQRSRSVSTMHLSWGKSIQASKYQSARLCVTTLSVFVRCYICFSLLHQISAYIFEIRKKLLRWSCLPVRLDSLLSSAWGSACRGWLRLHSVLTFKYVFQTEREGNHELLPSLSSAQRLKGVLGTGYESSILQAPADLLLWKEPPSICWMWWK